MSRSGATWQVSSQARHEILLREDTSAWARADLALSLIALMPGRLKGAVIEGAAPELAGLVQERLTQRLPHSAPLYRMPVTITDDRLVGGLDLAATLVAGRPVAEAGLLARAHGGVLIAPMAERLPAQTAAQLCRVMDTGIVQSEREGISSHTQSDFVILAFTDPAENGETLPSGLGDRLAFSLNLSAVSAARERPDPVGKEGLRQARARLTDVTVPQDIAEALIESALRLGILSMRAPGFCLSAARGLAALSGRTIVTDEDARRAAELVYAARAMTFPDPPLPPEPEQGEVLPGSDQTSQTPDDLTEMIVNAVYVRVALDMAARERARRIRSPREPAAGKSGDRIESGRRGSRIASQRGDPRRQGRLDLHATFTAAVPWQSIRQGRASDVALRVRPDDFRVKRYARRTEAVVIFVVDASGSAAMHRLSEAKGAIELLLSSCYARRESVALIAFRKDAADLLLPPTRSLTRVKRSLSRLAGGGGTPLASGIAAALHLARLERQRRKAPHIVFLSDGQGNIALDGSAGRERAAQDTKDMARRLKALSEPVMFFDISRRPSPEAQAISADMGAIYQPLPAADARLVSEAVRTRLLS